MFSDHHHAAWEQATELRERRAAPIESLRALSASDFVPLLWDKQFGCGDSFDRAILQRSVELKTALYGGRLFVIVPIYVTSICSEQCVYCNYRAGNQHASIERRRLSDTELEQEAEYLVEQKGQRVLELVYASDPRVRADSMCRHVELLRRVLDRHGGGLVAISAEALEENDYHRLADAGLSISVLWQETYDKSRYPLLHPGKTRKTDFGYRLDAYERMLSAGIPHVGMGVLLGLSDWRQDWAMLMLHEEYLRKHHGRSATVLGIPRLKHAPGALLQESPFTPSEQEFLVAIALHNIFSPTTAAFVSTRESWDVCLELARGGGCLFTLNCSTTPGGYSLQRGGCQFPSHSYDAPVYSAKLTSLGLEPVFRWNSQDLLGSACEAVASSYPTSGELLDGPP